MFNANAIEMNTTLDIRNNPNSVFENDAVIINLDTEEITWKPMMFDPKLRNYILLHLKARNK
jgi:hypothetical protein